SVDYGLVGDRRELHDSSPFGADSPLRLEQGCLLSQRGKRLVGVAEARRWRPKRRCCATQPAEHRTLLCSYQMCQAQWRWQRELAWAGVLSLGGVGDERSYAHTNCSQPVARRTWTMPFPAPALPTNQASLPPTASTAPASSTA